MKRPGATLIQTITADVTADALIHELDYTIWECKQQTKFEPLIS